MHHRHIPIILLFLLVIPGIVSASNSAVAGCINRFAADIYPLLARNNPETNLCFSPLSAVAAFDMVELGALGETRKQIRSVLHIDFSDSLYHTGMTNLTRALTTAGDTLAVANAVWHDRDLNVQPEFQADIDRWYRSRLQKVDFSQSDTVSRNINDWASRNTRGKITHVVDPGQITPLTSLVLANALYLKTNWASPFDAALTVPMAFRIPGRESVQTPMMCDTRSVQYLDGDGFRSVRLPYSGERLSMTIILPDATDGYGAIERDLTTKGIGSYLPEPGSQQVRMYIPRFEFRNRFELAQPLRELGMTHAFDPKTASFDRIAPGAGLYISFAVQGTYLRVDEQGTEAAAVTVVGMECSAIPFEQVKPIEFRADHPFLFVIRDEVSGVVLFMGRVLDPTAP